VATNTIVAIRSAIMGSRRFYNASDAGYQSSETGMC
jgi:hypothetical protein